MDALDEQTKSMLKALNEMQPSALEMSLFSSGYRLSAKQSKALLHAGSRAERDAIIASAASASLD